MEIFMQRLKTIGDIQTAAERLENSALQWLNSCSTASVNEKIVTGQKHLQECLKICSQPWKSIIMGQSGGEKNLLLNALLDSTELIPSQHKQNICNTLEISLEFRSAKKPPTLEKSQLILVNKEQSFSIVNKFLQLLSDKSISLPTQIESWDDLQLIEDILVSAPASSIMSYQAIEYIIALKNNISLISDKGHIFDISSYQLNSCLFSENLSLANTEKSLAEFQQQCLDIQEKQPSLLSSHSKLETSEILAIFPLIYKVFMSVDVWEDPFQEKLGSATNPIIFINIPDLSKQSSVKDLVLLEKEIFHIHSLLFVLDSAHVVNNKISELERLFWDQLKKLGDRTILAFNRFEKFPYFSSSNYSEFCNRGDKTGFSSILQLSKSICNDFSNQVYLCSAVSYLFESRMERSNWVFGKSQWFANGERQASHSLFKRNRSQIEKYIYQLSTDPKLKLEKQSKLTLEKYLEKAGVPKLRNALIRMSKDKGQQYIKEKALHALHSAYTILTKALPQNGEPSINIEITSLAQKFYRDLEVAIADAFPSGPSHFQKLMVRDKNEDLPLWEIMERHISSRIVNWPEWFAILNQNQEDRQDQKEIHFEEGRETKTFGRYNKLKKSGTEVPKEFEAFNERFQETAEEIYTYSLEMIEKSILYSIERFENHPDYQQICETFRSAIDLDKLMQSEEGLPLMDAWKPSQMAKEDILPEIIERVKDETEAMKNLRYPYDVHKPCNWNMALIVRIQVQILKTLRDRISRLIASAEANFQSFFINEIFRGEILPLVRGSLHNNQFLAAIVKTDGLSPTTGNETLRDILGSIKVLQ